MTVSRDGIMIEGELVASSLTRGRYQVGEDGPELTRGDILEVLLGGQWLAGSVEHATFLYAADYWVYQRSLRGYYFIADAGGICGLCVGMRVRKPA